MRLRKSLGYNALALVGVGLGLVNALLVMKLLGTSEAADAWLLSLAIIGVLTPLFQLGVEQFLYAFEDARTVSSNAGARFLSAAVCWSLLSGSALSLIAVLSINPIVGVFGSGLDQAWQNSVQQTVIWLVPTLVAAPLAHVARQHQNALGRYASAYLLLSWFPFVLFVLLVSALGTGRTPSELVWIGALGGCAQILLCLGLVWPHMAKNIGREDFAAPFKRFVGTSAKMRVGHTIHNFAASAIINGALSQYAPGSIALYQYASRFAAGVLSIAVGPHASIYHSTVAKLWSQKQTAEIPVRQKTFRKHVLPIQLAATAVVALLLPLLASVYTSYQGSGAELTSVFLLVSLWNIVIQLETVHVGVVAAAKVAWGFIAINFVFAVNLFVLSKIVDHFASPLLLVSCAASAQLFSLILYKSLALRLRTQLQSA